MKNIGLFLLSLFFFVATSEAQTYNINTATNPAVGGVCPGNVGIDNTYDCSFDGNPPITLGTFTDTNIPTFLLSTMNLTIYGACSGNVTFFLNGTQIASGTAAGLSCSCQSIAGDPNIPQAYAVTVTPAIQAAFIAGGINTLSVSTTGSAAGAQCFYGADVSLSTVVGPPTVGATNVPTMGEWGIICFLLILSSVGIVELLKRRQRVVIQ